MLLPIVLIFTSVIILGSPSAKNILSSKYYQKQITVSPTPFSTITPIASVKPSVTPTTVKKTTIEYLLSEVNAYRKTQGLTLVKMDVKSCAFAQVRAQELATQFDHTGFTTRIENKTLPYPKYSEVAENIAKTSDYEQVINMWLSSTGHAENMRKNTPFVCIRQFGNYFAYEGWRP